MGILLLLGIFLIAGALGGSGATTIRVDAQLLAPGTTAPFGTDELGRDILASTARAGIFSALLALLVTLLAVGSGSGIGLAAGLAGGITKRLTMTIIDSLLAFPGLLLAIALAVFIGPGLFGMIVALALPAAAAVCRILAAEAARHRDAEFLAVARAAGANRWWILTRHLARLARPLLVVRTTQLVPQVVLAEATLSFLGLGISPQQPSLGQMIEVGRHHLGDNPWMMVLPGLCLGTMTLGLGLLGEGVRQRTVR